MEECIAAWPQTAWPQTAWPQYEERLGHFFTAYGIDNADKKLAVLLTVIGAANYKLYTLQSGVSKIIRGKDVATIYA